MFRKVGLDKGLFFYKNLILIFAPKVAKIASIYGVKIQM